MSQIVSLDGVKNLDDFFAKNLSVFNITDKNLLNLHNLSLSSSGRIYYGNLNTFIRIVLILIMRAGFILAQVGSIPTQCVYTMTLKNVLDMVTAIVGFALIGTMLAFGADVGGFLGHGWFVGKSHADLDLHMYGTCACILGNAISSTLTSDRLHVACLVFMSVFHSAVFVPVVMHQGWHPDGWMARNRVLGRRVALKDHGGALLVHHSSGVAGAVGALVLGRRLIKLSSIHECSISPSAAAYVPLGYFLQLVGLMAITLLLPGYETFHAPKSYVSLLITNQLMALSGGMLSVLVILLALCTRTFDYWKVLRLIEGGVAGMVCVASGVDIYTPLASFIIATVHGVIFYFSLVFIFRTSIEDYCNIIATHVISGLVAPLLPPFFASAENLGFSVSFSTRMVHFLWQLICLLAVTSMTVAVYLAFFMLFKVAGLLRNSAEEENHERSKAVHGLSFSQIVRDIHNTAQSEPIFEPGFASRGPSISDRPVGNFMSVRTSPTKSKFGIKKKLGFLGV